MKILLLGDMSSLHVNLARGLRYHGLDVTLASSGDGAKQLKYDLKFGSNGSFLKKEINKLNFIRKKLNQYDLIQLINARHLGVSSALFIAGIHTFSNIKPRFFMVAAGCDYKFWTVGRKKLNIPLFDEIEKYDGSESFLKRCADWLIQQCVETFVDGIIPCVAEYQLTYHGNKKLLPAIPLSIDLEEYPFTEMNFNGKLQIYHGSHTGREGFKGTFHIQKAFEALNKKYASDLSCVVSCGFSHKDYLNRIRNVHILFDQTNAATYGMAAIEAMALGKIVATCSQDHFFYDQWMPIVNIEKKPPIIPITPDFKQIIRQVEWILENRPKLKLIAEEQRAYVEKHHDCKEIAKDFLKRWNLLN